MRSRVQITGTLHYNLVARQSLLALMTLEQEEECHALFDHPIASAASLNLAKSHERCVAAHCSHTIALPHHKRSPVRGDQHLSSDRDRRSRFVNDALPRGQNRQSDADRIPAAHWKRTKLQCGRHRAIECREQHARGVIAGLAGLDIVRGVGGGEVTQYTNLHRTSSSFLY